MQLFKASNNQYQYELINVQGNQNNQIGCCQKLKKQLYSLMKHFKKGPIYKMDMMIKTLERYQREYERCLPGVEKEIQLFYKPFNKFDAMIPQDEIYHNTVGMSRETKLFKGLMKYTNKLENVKNVKNVQEFEYIRYLLSEMSVESAFEQTVGKFKEFGNKIKEILQILRYNKNNGKYSIKDLEKEFENLSLIRNLRLDIGIYDLRVVKRETLANKYVIQLIKYELGELVSQDKIIQQEEKYKRYKYFPEKIKNKIHD